MTSSTPFRTVEIETETFAVVRTDPAKPLVLEIVATFYDAARAQEYAVRQNGQRSALQQEVVLEPAPKVSTLAPKSAEKSAPQKAQSKKAEPESAADTADLTDRQNAVLNALRSKMNVDKSVETKAAVLADAAGVPLGSLHSILQSLEKKELIRNTRAGSAKTPAAYQVF
jgi:uncharacterized membrane protein